MPRILLVEDDTALRGGGIALAILGLVGVLNFVNSMVTSILARAGRALRRGIRLQKMGWIATV